MQGTDLEKIFKLDDPATTDVVVDDGNDVPNVASSETNPTSVEYEQVKILTRPELVSRPSQSGFRK